MASQKARLQNTAAGRAILHRTGTAMELRALDGQRSLPPEVRSKITANPIPKHMSHELHEGRHKARVNRQRRQFKSDPYVQYVDVAAYPAGGLFAVAAVNGRDNSLTLAASVRAETPAAAETIAAALVIKQHDRVGREVHVVTDSQQACRNFTNGRTPDNGDKLKSKIIRASRMHPMPKEHAKIIIRPRGALNIAKTGPTVIGKAIVEAAGLSPTEISSDIICPSIQPNIMVASTPNRDNASKYTRIRALHVAGRMFECFLYRKQVDTCYPCGKLPKRIAPDPGAEAFKSGSSPARGPAPGIADPSATRPGPTEFEERRKR
ncbi:hypothetical protein HPB49_017773 [Dermacentor silvarum]|uniref:Uncharacterized protein n=1 Tax=Dermacentor silvarum TaxID=543639 RepID=A0ACB8D788_DERSI|nr:hypothetical protein HPB49_017773 [Dermacentor silvarum]